MTLSSVSAELELSVAIPTYGREQVLVDTIGQLLEQRPRAAEIIVVDQTSCHEQATEAALRRWEASGDIRWLRLSRPSQPAALNLALREATQPLVLMLDDDIRIEAGFLSSHVQAFMSSDTWAVVGQVLQPGETELDAPASCGVGPFADMSFPFRGAQPAWVANGMSGNMTVRRDRALALGGFDENFLPPVSYRFDSDFCKRLVAKGGRIRFEPRARIHHLRASRGGTRSIGNHMTSMSGLHGAGDYYFALRRGVSAATLLYILRRPWREIRTRFHLRHPWWIPVKLVGELLGIVLAVHLLLRGPRLLSPDRSTSEHRQ